MVDGLDFLALKTDIPFESLIWLSGKLEKKMRNIAENCENCEKNCEKLRKNDKLRKIAKKLRISIPPPCFVPHAQCGGPYASHTVLIILKKKKKLGGVWRVHHQPNKMKSHKAISRLSQWYHHNIGDKVKPEKKLNTPFHKPAVAVEQRRGDKKFVLLTRSVVGGQALSVDKEGKDRGGGMDGNF